MWRAPALAHNDCASPEADMQQVANAIAAAAGRQHYMSMPLSSLRAFQKKKCCRSLKNELKLSLLQGVCCCCVDQSVFDRDLLLFLLKPFLLLTVNI
jgi:hypothetical protein